MSEFMWESRSGVRLWNVRCPLLLLYVSEGERAHCGACRVFIADRMSESKKKNYTTVT